MFPFHHVTVEDVEFVLWGKDEDQIDGKNSVKWRATDEYGNKVGICEQYMVKAPPMAFQGAVPLKHPKFFRHDQDIDEIFELDILNDIYQGKSSGIAKDGWKWETETLTVTNGTITQDLRVFTLGGWWL